MTSRFKVTVARRCAPRVKELRGEAKKSFERVVEELRHRGCEAGGTRMRAETGGDHRVCERRFYRDWRMHLVFGDQNEVVISWVGRHTEDEPVHLEGARDIPGLSGVGCPRDRRPQCCDSFDDPPPSPTWSGSSTRSALPVVAAYPDERTSKASCKLEMASIHISGGAISSWRL